MTLAGQPGPESTGAESARPEGTGGESARPEGALREPRPGVLWRWVKVASWVELVIFAALCFFWLAPGYRDQELWFGLGHGVGYIALVALIVVTCFRHQAPYIVLAASLTPVGPLGTVIAIEWVERKKPAYRRGARPAPTASA